MRTLSRRTSAIADAWPAPLSVYSGPLDAASLVSLRATGVVISTERCPVAPTAATEDTVLSGRGIAAAAASEERASVLGAALRHLLGRGGRRPGPRSGPGRRQRLR